MRWLVRRTSSSSDEMNTQALPSSASDRTSRWISALAPTSMPRVGSSRIRTLRVGRQPARQDHLLLVAAAQVPDRLVGRRRGDLEQLDVPVGDLVLLGEAQVTGTSRGWPGRPGRCSRGRSGRRRCPRPCGPPGRAPRPARSSRAASSGSTGLPSTVERAAVGLVDAEQQAGDLGAPGAEQPGQPDDLAGVQLQVERLDRAARPSRAATSRVSPTVLGRSASLILVMSSSSVRFRPSIFAIRSRRGSVGRRRRSRPAARCAGP